MLATLASRALPCVSLAAATAILAPASSGQDCWTPDQLEPNDGTAVVIGAGTITDLSLHLAAPGIAPDHDRFRVTIPAYQRMTAEFTAHATDVVTSPAAMNYVSGTVTDLAGTQKTTTFSTSPFTYNIAHAAYFDNDSASPIDVEIDASAGVMGVVGCLDYDLHVSFGPRPCDALPDDAMEGPEDCATATVLQAGAYENLIVFNEVRLAGADSDYFLIPNVQPGDWFQLSVSSNNNPALFPVFFSVADAASCPGTPTLQQPLFFANTTGLPQDYVVQVETTSLQGFAEYDLELIYTPTSSLQPDVFEPNPPCVAPPIIAEGLTEATLTFGDKDAYLIGVPPQTQLRATVRTSSPGLAFRINADHGTCPPVGSSSTTSYLNDSAMNRGVVLRVDSESALSGHYELETELIPIPCSSTDVMRNEPDDDCASATPLSLEPAFDSNDSEACAIVTLDGTDTDSFVFDVPPRSVLTAEIRRSAANSSDVDRPAVMLRAFPDGDCANTPRLAQPRATNTMNAGLVYAELLLPNRGDAPATFALQVDRLTNSATHPCEQYDLSLVATPIGEYDVPTNILNGSCDTAETVGTDLVNFTGIVTSERPTFAVTEVRPGETLTVSVGSFSRSAPLRLALHDGFADCAAGGASFGSITDSFLPLPSASTQLQLSHTNTTIGTQRVVVECGFAGGYAPPQVALTVDLQRSPSAPYGSFCDSEPSGDRLVPCPCENHDPRAAGTGCRNSTGLGARLTAVGTTSLQADNLFLRASDLPPRTIGVVFEGSSPNGSAPWTLHDGRFCLSWGASGTPLLVTANSAGNWSATAPTASSVNTQFFRSALQVWYRDRSGPCGSGSNTTNAIRIDWTL